MADNNKNIYTKTYHDIIQVVKDFFDGNNKPIKQELYKQIQQCIVDQNFERAAKLRDIYNNIDTLTQKQSVVLPDTKINGIFYKVIHVWTKWIYAIVVFQNGKLVDILRFEEDDNIDLESIISSIELDFGDVTLEKDKNQNTYWYSRILKPTKSILKIILSHIDDYITSFISSITWKDQYLINNILDQLQTKYLLKTYPYKIECLDISHLSGSWASGWLSCMQWWLFYKKWYRQYKIKVAKGGDDYDSLRECIIRRFKLEEEKQDIYTIQPPDLFIIDGGIWQLGILWDLAKKYPRREELTSHTQFVSLGKWSARKSSRKIYWEKEILYRYEDNKIEWIELDYDETDKILIKCRDEAHRFANRYRKKQMSKEIKK